MKLIKSLKIHREIIPKLEEIDKLSIPAIMKNKERMQINYRI